MMRARDLRTKAREALRGHWGAAVAVGFVATLLTGGVGISNSGGSASAEGYLDFVNHNVWIVAMTVAVVSVLLAVVIGGAVQMGWCMFNIKLVKREQVRFGDLFSQFHRLWDGVRMIFIMAFFIILWSLLLFVPGIIAAYRYAMVPYLMAEFPGLTVMDAMRESKRLMQGNKWRLFCLELSFLGWALLGVLTFGIGTLWVTPYIEAARAAFYLEVTGRQHLMDSSQSPSYENRGPEF